MTTQNAGNSPASWKQLTLYVIFGVVQLGIDWIVFVALSFSGLPVPAANVISRLTAAVAGYLLNGAVTFRSGAASRSKLTGDALLRYAALWLMLTAISTGAVFLIESQTSISMARLAKPGVEGCLAVLSFLAMKLWVYK